MLMLNIFIIFYGYIIFEILWLVISFFEKKKFFNFRNERVNRVKLLLGNLCYLGV